MTTFLCWNLNNKPLQDLVSNIARSRDVDVVILLECRISVARLLQSLNPEGEQFFEYAGAPIDVRGEAPTQTIKIFTPFSANFLRPVEDDTRLTIRHLRLPRRTDAILAVVRLPSKLRQNDSDQKLRCANLTRSIADAENSVGHTRTILVGDLNMNPFEEGVVGADGLNATMVRRQALKGFRTLQQQQYPFFYNPMWGHFGDGDDKPAGTYHHVTGHVVTYYWNMFDQVLVRPGLLERLPKDGVEILTEAGIVPLLTKSGRPNASIGSDHLPLLFRIGL
jgi:endonuclease/exonuclease/phosphatase (EEP) superfamily protein YafD